MGYRKGGKGRIGHYTTAQLHSPSQAGDKKTSCGASCSAWMSLLQALWVAVFAVATPTFVRGPLPDFSNPQSRDLLEVFVVTSEKAEFVFDCGGGEL